MLTFETAAVQGVTGIVEKLTVWSLAMDLLRANIVKTLPFQKVIHKVATLDAQPSNESGGILVMVTGQLLVSENRNMSYDANIRAYGCNVGGRGAAADELYSGFPAFIRRRRQLLRI